MKQILLTLAFLLLSFPVLVSAQQTESLTFEWDANPASDLAGYHLHWGKAPMDYTNIISVGNVLTGTIPDLEIGTTYYFGLTADDLSGNRSEYSDEIVHVVLDVTAPPKTYRFRMTTITTP